MSHVVMNHFSSSKSLTGESESRGGESPSGDSLVETMDIMTRSINNMNFVVESIKRDLYGDFRDMLDSQASRITDLKNAIDVVDSNLSKTTSQFVYKFGDCDQKLSEHDSRISSAFDKHEYLSELFESEKSSVQSKMSDIVTEISSLNVSLTEKIDRNDELVRNEISDLNNKLLELKQNLDSLVSGVTNLDSQLREVVEGHQDTSKANYALGIGVANLITILSALGYYLMK